MYDGTSCSQYYQSMHISKIEFLVNDNNIDRRLDAYLDARVEVLPESTNNNNTNNDEITQDDINESVRTIPTPKRAHS